MDINVLINQLIQLFLIICLGYLMNKVNIIDANFNQKGSKLIINVTMPAMIVSSVLSLSDRPDSADVLIVFAVSIAMYLLLPVIAFLLTKITKTSADKQGVYMFMYIFSNVGFMGFPILDAVFGATAVFYAGIVNIIFNIACYSYGILVINHGSDADCEMNFKKLLSPGILCSFVAIIIYAFNLHFPATIESTLATVGGLTSTFSMIIIGSTLATINLKEIFNDGYIYVFAFLKQLILPLLLMPVCRFFLKDELIYGVTMMMLLMPVANTAVLFTTDFGHDEQLAAKTVFITTALSLITIPIGMIICY